MAGSGAWEQALGAGMGSLLLGEGQANLLTPGQPYDLPPPGNVMARLQHVRVSIHPALLTVATKTQPPGPASLQGPRYGLALVSRPPCIQRYARQSSARLHLLLLHCKQI